MMVGTCRKNRLGMPADLFQRRQHQGDFDYRKKGQLIVTRWFDKQEVVTLSTLPKPELRITPGRFEVKEKPLAVIDYIWVSIQTTILLNKHRRQHGRRITTLSSVIKELVVSLAGTDLTIDAVEDTVNLSLARLHEHHFIKMCPPTGELGKARCQCKVCTYKAKKAGATHEERKNKRKLVPTWCPVCKVGLCLDCFELYHTKA
ncbi:PiggyBac transposable element-derived protein 4 [Plakobranchus ocellatus]|uniref:PiggyBac transposable element-derived protein 4 n=1 Tax=Plakobranchus ocellatus TaxID=259542 RepID=A0AAV4B3P2_9GAST|nr:PiggyBac transposable element-derived protein 4 [Plakobranchus ocellatus]